MLAIKNITGQYELKSPYHKRKMLPFNVLRKNLDGTFRVKTVEYSGKKCFPIDIDYTENNINRLIAKKIIAIKKKN